MTCRRCGLRGVGHWLDDGDWSCICGCVTYCTAALPLLLRDVELPTAAASIAGEARARERERRYRRRKAARA